jgi:5-methylcytosine-specific restriction endonuclease McrA
MKRTPFKRKKKYNPEYNAFMKQFRGMPCFICGTKFALGYPTAGHHILYQSTHPEYKLEPMNVVPLCPECHVPIAHEQPDRFRKILKELSPEHFAWMEEHDNHRK